MYENEAGEKRQMNLLYTLYAGKVENMKQMGDEDERICVLGVEKCQFPLAIMKTSMYNELH